MSKSKMKKNISVFISIAIILSAAVTLPVASSANSIHPDPVKMNFDKYIIACIENFQSEINILPYINQRLTANGSTINSVVSKEVERVKHEFTRVLDENPQLFHIKNYGEVAKFSAPASVPSNGGTVSFKSFTISGINYITTKAQYAEQRKTFDDEVNKALSAAKGASTEFEKVLAIHDFLVLNVAYDKENLDHAVKTGNLNNPLRPLSHTSYGALVNNLAVCDGYSRAYMYLMNLLGVETKLIDGKMSGNGAQNIEHSWNQIKIGGRWFHIDITSNDPLLHGMDIYGAVDHKYFLLSDAALKEAGSHTWSNGETANTSVYDKDFFRNAKSSIIKLGDFYYWLEADAITGDIVLNGTNNINLKSHNIETGETKTVNSFHSIWFTNGSELERAKSFSTSTFSSLIAYNGKLYFNSAKDICAYDPQTGISESVVRPSNIGGAGNRFIFGMTVQSNKITYSIKTAASVVNTFLSSNLADIKSSSLTINRSTLTLVKSATSTLRVTLNPTDAGDFIHWVSSDVNVATVNSNGKVTAVNKGSATITAFLGNGLSKTCTVTVN